MQKVVLLSLLMMLLSLPTLTVAEDWSEPELYQAKCGRCHRVYEPGEFTSGQWRDNLRSMRARAGLSEDEMERLGAYLGAASAADAGERAPAGPQLGGYLYTEYFRTEDEAENFDLHYLAISLSGWVGESVEYLGEFEFEHGGKGDNAFVEQAWLDYWVGPNVALKSGAMLTPFNRFDEYHEPLSNPLITRPQVSREIGVSAWKDVGVDLHGYFKLGAEASMDFNLYAINGLGSGANLRGSRQYRDNNADLALGARLSFVLANRLEIGASAYRGAWDDAGEQDLRLLGAHLRLSNSPVDIHAEYSRADSENPGPAADGEMSGYFVQISRLFHDRLRPVLRLGELDYLDPGGELGRDAGKGDKSQMELAIGLAYHLEPGVVFKFEYSQYRMGDRIPGENIDRIGVQAAVGF